MMSFLSCQASTHTGFVTGCSALGTHISEGPPQGRLQADSPASHQKHVASALRSEESTKLPTVSLSLLSPMYSKALLILPSIVTA